MNGIVTCEGVGSAKKWKVLFRFIQRSILTLWNFRLIYKYTFQRFKPDPQRSTCQLINRKLRSNSLTFITDLLNALSPVFNKACTIKNIGTIRVIWSGIMRFHKSVNGPPLRQNTVVAYCNSILHNP